MAFIEGTKIFTNKGFKNVEEIAGQDKVLVRNFIGDAEFIQPFALKKRHYDGKIVKLGGQNWSFSVTPEHMVVYDRDDAPLGKNITYLPAKDVEIHNNNRIYRKFKYLSPNEYKREQIIIRDEFGKKYSTISNEDWFTLCAYVLCKGQVDYVTSKRPALNIYIDEDKAEHQIIIIGGILDRIGVPWSVLKRDRYFIRVSTNNNLAHRVVTRLGSKVRKQMFLTDKMIYHANRQLADMFFDTLIDVSIKDTTKKQGSYQYVCGKKLADSLVLFGTLNGYGISSSLSVAEGTQTAKAVVKRDIYKVVIAKPTQSYSPTKKETLDYKGYVYEIDLFDGQVYVKDGMPVWVNPK